MFSVEKKETTLKISKINIQSSSFVSNETSRGLSSGNIKVTKTESELCIRPCSPDRYKSRTDYQEITPSTKFETFKDSENSFLEFSESQKIFQTPIKDMSLYLELDIEEVGENMISFFSSGSEVKELESFECGLNKGDCNSFASTRSKTEKALEQFIKCEGRNKMNYKNSCRIQCCGCKEAIVTDLKMVYLEDSWFRKVLCAFCVGVDKKVECTYFCSKCKRFLTYHMDDLEFNLN